MTADQGSWVYAVACGIEPEWLDGVPGVAGNPVRLVGHGDLAAATSRVSLAEFGQEPLRRNLEDLDWLERTARAHHYVIGAVARHRPVIPLRLATVYRDDDSVMALLATRSADFDAALARVTGRAEWGVKAYPAQPHPAPEERVPAATAAAPEARPGAAYLRRRRDELSESEKSRRAVTAAANAVHAALAAAATAAQVRPPQARQLVQQAAPMILNGTYLIDDERSRDFTALVEKLAARHPGLQLELTGPWPPYSFATVPGQEP